MKPIIVTDKIYENDKLKYLKYFEINYSYSNGTKSTLHKLDRDSFLDQVHSGKLYPINTSIDQLNRIKIFKSHSKSATLVHLVKSVRSFMEHLYGTETDLAGHCIEASEIIVETLKMYGIQAKTVEGWCLFDDLDYGSDRPYDHHTWVELVNKKSYIDVTADQFNVAMYEENEFEPVIIQNHLPFGMMLNEPVEDIDY